MVDKFGGQLTISDVGIQRKTAKNASTKHFIKKQKKKTSHELTRFFTNCPSISFEQSTKPYRA